MQKNASKLTAEDLVNLFQISEEATMTAREKAERDRDYVDGIQYTAEQIAELNKRRQPVVTDNRIKPKIDFIVGIEKQSRIDPRALPRTPVHEEDADGATQALRSVTDKEDYDTKRSAVWRNMLVEGAGGIRVYVEPSKSKYGAFDIKIDQIAWDRMFWDLKSDPTITQAQREVVLQMENERLFEGGDMLWDGVIIKEVHDMYSELGSVLANKGDSATVEVGCGFLCGAQALGVAYGRRWKTVTEDFDYGDKKGVEISSIYGVGKMQFGSGSSDRADLKDHGLVTGYFATTD